MAKDKKPKKFSRTRTRSASARKGTAALAGGMDESALIAAISKLPLERRMHLLEETIREMRRETLRAQMTLAAERMEEEYRTDPELTAFTSIDMDSFYEAR